MKPRNIRLNTYTKNTVKRENFNSKNTEIAFYPFKQFGYLSLHIRDKGDSVEVFRLFSVYLKNKAFKYLKNQRSFLEISSNASYVPRHWKRQ